MLGHTQKMAWKCLGKTNHLQQHNHPSNYRRATNIIEQKLNLIFRYLNFNVQIWPKQQIMSCLSSLVSTVRNGHVTAKEKQYLHLHSLHSWNTALLQFKKLWQLYKAGNTSFRDWNFTVYFKSRNFRNQLNFVHLSVTKLINRRLQVF